MIEYKEQHCQIVTFTDGSQMEIEDKPIVILCEREIFWSKDHQHLVSLVFPERINENLRTILCNLVSLSEETINLSLRNWIILWPEKIVIEPRLGLSMRKMSKSVRPIVQYIHSKFWATQLSVEEKGSWADRVAAARNLSDAFQWIHKKGMIYGDPDPTNLYVDMHDHGKLYLDIIRSQLFSENRLTQLEYTSPELVEKVWKPSQEDDLHFLAVILYRLLLFSHPLIGLRSLDPDPCQNELLSFGQKALYIEHPLDASNRPLKMKYTSDLLGSEMKALFIRAFVDGLHTPHLRPTAAEWEIALQHLMQEVVTCGNINCRMKGFIRLENKTLCCPWCGWEKR